MSRVYNNRTGLCAWRKVRGCTDVSHCSDSSVDLKITYHILRCLLYLL